MTLIRDTINPLNEREVSDEEALDLERMGIRLTGTRAKTPDGLHAAAVRQATEHEAAAFAAELSQRPVVFAGGQEQDDAGSVGTDGDTADSVTATLDDQADTTQDDQEG